MPCLGCVQAVSLGLIDERGNVIASAAGRGRGRGGAGAGAAGWRNAGARKIDNRPSVVVLHDVPDNLKSDAALKSHLQVAFSRSCDADGLLLWWRLLIACGFRCACLADNGTGESRDYQRRQQCRRSVPQPQVCREGLSHGACLLTAHVHARLTLWFLSVAGARPVVQAFDTLSKKGGMRVAWQETSAAAAAVPPAVSATDVPLEVQSADSSNPVCAVLCVRVVLRRVLSNACFSLSLDRFRRRLRMVLPAWMSPLSLSLPAAMISALTRRKTPTVKIDRGSM